MRSGYWPSILVGLAVASALGVAFSSVVIGVTVGAAVAVVLAWEQRAHRS